MKLFELLFYCKCPLCGERGISVWSKLCGLFSRRRFKYGLRRKPIKCRCCDRECSAFTELYLFLLVLVIAVFALIAVNILELSTAAFMPILILIVYLIVYFMPLF